MSRFSFDFADPGMPRTIYYENLAKSIQNHRDYTPSRDDADFVFPKEDTSIERNWPRYGRPETAYVSDQFDRTRYLDYLRTLTTSDLPICIVNMHPFNSVTAVMAKWKNTLVADINLIASARHLNPRSISMPAMPITVGTCDVGNKRTLAGFRGSESHPCRAAIAKLHNGTTIRTELVDPANHLGRLDAERATADDAYVEIMQDSLYAFVPRGDAHFSYRLLEAMSFGCIPVVIADDLVLPFDRCVPWAGCSLHIAEDRIAECPDILASIPFSQLRHMQQCVIDAYTRFFANFDCIVDTLITEIEIILNTPDQHR